MSFKCEICDKSFKTNQHLNQHKNRKKKCQKNNQTVNNNSDFNYKDILEIKNNLTILLEENTILKNTIEELERNLLNIKFKQQLTKKFIKYILNYDDVEEEILENISILLSKAEKQKNKGIILPSNISDFNLNNKTSNMILNLINTINSSGNSSISDLTCTPPNILDNNHQNDSLTN